MSKSLLSELTHRSYSKAKNPDGTRTPQLRIGVEARIDYHPFLEDWGDRYQSIVRTALNELQYGQSEDNIEKTFQRRFDIDWAWADSIATDAKGTFDQLTEARALRIKALNDDIKAGWESVASTIELMSQQLALPSRKNMKGFARRLMGLESKVNRLERKQVEKEELEKAKRLHICFGGAKLFNAQYHLENNGYSSHDEWRADWEKKRGGNFYSIGSGSVVGNNRVAKIFYIQDDIFSVTFTVPRYLRGDYGDTVSLEFEVSGQRKHNLLYALESGKPVTVQCFRREHKNDQWYIHLTTYVQDVPTISNLQNGCIGIDLNAETIDVIYIKRDGNPERCRNAISFPIPTGTTGQKEAKLRDIVCEIVKLAEIYQCPIACENLDFSTKKNQLRHSLSKEYNRMLSGFIYDKFRSYLVVRSEKYGIEILFKSPFLTSVIGMVKYMQKYGLNSASSAAMVIGRRALGFREYIPQQWLKTLTAFFRPEDWDDAGFGGGWRAISAWLKKFCIRRPRMFELDTVLRFLLDSLVLESQKKTYKKRKPGGSNKSGGKRKGKADPTEAQVLLEREQMKVTQKGAFTVAP
ncbi:transposase, IS605 OrfB family protein (plasmid) [Calothrix sp. NIES-4071]|nr:transposase, IS605 OrfB family protein [Calothrix sp. NIES-4071]BAZ64904.1 transposase, IS605 OrfB family protein [Calothrix sp. NIES-4105]